mmetsp:Transcript_134503/g.326888  ORF Transcript_134503/g.326888 Transcript_134503/m.326888 type:complete len:243 (+) Transcript_134503:4743-5471(+)
MLTIVKVDAHQVGNGGSTVLFSVDAADSVDGNRGLRSKVETFLVQNVSTLSVEQTLAALVLDEFVRQQRGKDGKLASLRNAPVEVADVQSSLVGLDRAVARRRAVPALGVRVSGNRGVAIHEVRGELVTVLQLAVGDPEAPGERRLHHLSRDCVERWVGTKVLALQLELEELLTVARLSKRGETIQARPFVVDHHLIAEDVEVEPGRTDTDRHLCAFAGRQSELNSLQQAHGSGGLDVPGRA